MRVYSPEFDYLYIISSFLKSQEVKRYTGTSILTLVIATSSDAAFYLQKNGWIVMDEPYIIKHIKQELEEITVTAYGGHQLLRQRVTAPATGQYAIEYTGSADAVVKYFINQSKRGLPLVTATVQGGVSISDQSRWKNLGDEVERVLIGAGRGARYTLDSDNQQIIFDTYLGTDRSVGNADDNPPVVFDLKYKNIAEYTYTEDATVEQTTVYVGGQGEGVDREIITTGDDATGIDRTEVFVDARDVEQGDTAKLTERAAQATIPAAQTVSATAVADANLVYGVDYALGDIVTTNVPVRRYVKNGDYYDPVTETIQVNQRITEVVITREDGAEHIDLTFGYQPITQSQVQRLRAEVAQLKAVEPVGFLPLAGGTVTGNLVVNGTLNVGTNTVWHQGNLPIETGTWTPYIYGGTTAGTPSYADRSGYYMRFGDLCYISMMLALSSKGGMTGILHIGGLPFPASTVTQFAIIGGAIQAHNGSKVSGQLDRGNTFFSLHGDSSEFNATLAHDNFSLWGMSGIYKIQT